jgi:catechol 2,3-dioxygenase-like lactoylglutathione lyase family enzyme
MKGLITALAAGSLFLVLPFVFAACSRPAAETLVPGISANLLFFYYADLAGAQRFYEDILGIERVLDYGFASIHRVGPTSFLGLVDGGSGMHSPDEPKTVTLSFITGEVDGWYAHLEGRGIRMHRPLGDATRHPTRGFVALDPEGYFLEFETFLDHPQNVELRATLAARPTLYPEGTSAPDGPGRPSELGVQGTVFWLYYKDIPAAQRFYEKALGASLLVDQGFAKVYSSTAAGFIGLVDEAQGLHRFSEAKAVNVAFVTPDVDLWFECLKSAEAPIKEPLGEAEEGLVRAFVALDPAGYFLEFNWFRPDPKNERILGLLSKTPE